MTETLTQSLSVPALEKGMDVLAFLAEQENPVSLQEIATKLHRSRGELYRMVAWLVEQSYVIRSEANDKYVLGERVGLLFRRQPVAENIISDALPLMTILSKSTGFACHLSIRAKSNCIVVAATESQNFYNLTAAVGSMIPLWECPAGACMINDLLSDEKNEILKQADSELRIKFQEETAEFERFGYVQRFNCAGPGILELAFSIVSNSRLKSAITMTKLLSSNNDISGIVKQLKELSTTSVGNTSIFGEVRP